MPLDILAFVRKWNASTLTERSGYQQHFRDLCEALDVPHPTQEDETGASYTFEKHIPKTGGGKGFADVWKRGFFAWEYKSKGGDLKAALKQVNEYHAALDNPPLLVVCDFTHFEVHTRFENLPPRAYKFTLDDLLVPRDTPTSALPPLEVLRHVFGDYNQLRPNVTSARVTEAAASDFLKLAQRIELERAAQPNPPSKEQIAHFLMRLVFCLFADSVGLLPNHAFRRLVTNDRFSPLGFNRKLPVLFQAMSAEGGFFGADNIPYFNGNLFRPNDHLLELDLPDLAILFSASQHDWSHIAPAIFGTLFERSLDEAKRSLIGAHYTSEDDILLLVEPVIMQPLLRRWESAKAAVLAALADEKASAETSKSPARLNLNRPALTMLQDFATELTSVRILDPACGSGNFLYVALKRLLDLWAEARNFGLQHGLSISLDPMPNPAQLFGIETDFYAHEIASIVVWIGFLQWKHDHGIRDEKEPLLQKLNNIEHGDAIMRYDAEGNPYEPTWPQAHYIVSNPPFLGGTQMRKELGDTYCDDLRSLYAGSVKGAADLVAYWFEKARVQIERTTSTRAGMIATQGIRGGANQWTLRRIAESAQIFWAISDKKWNLPGAMVHVSLVAFSGGFLESKTLNGQPTENIYPDLTGLVETTNAKRLSENFRICFEGGKKHGAFDIPQELGEWMLQAPLNPNGRPNSDVVHPWINALDITRRPRHMFIIDFGTSMSEAEAALYERPFEYVLKNVYPERQLNRREARKERWWLHGETNPGMRASLLSCPRFISTPRVSKHRLFVWTDAKTIPDSATCAIARSDDYFLGILHVTLHEVWARALGTQLREVESGFRYTPKSTFDTFPFPWPPGTEPKDDPRVKAIAVAARELVRLRDAWLNPEKPKAVEPKQWELDLKKRTLTNLYNERPTWLANAHRTLDEAVFAAYGWPANLTTQEVLARLLALNHERASAQDL